MVTHVSEKQRLLQQRGLNNKVAVAVLLTNRFRKFRENGPSENVRSFLAFSRVFRQPQSDQNKVASRLISPLWLAVYSESCMRISIKVCLEVSVAVNCRDFGNYSVI